MVWGVVLHGCRWLWVPVTVTPGAFCRDDGCSGPLWSTCSVPRGPCATVHSTKGKHFLQFGQLCGRITLTTDSVDNFKMEFRLQSPNCRILEKILRVITFHTPPHQIAEGRVHVRVGSSSCNILQLDYPAHVTAVMSHRE